MARAADRILTFAQIAVVAWIFGTKPVGDLYFLASIVPLTLALAVGDPLGRAALRSLSDRTRDALAARYAAAGFTVATAFLLLLTLLYAGVAVVAVKVATPSGSAALGPWLAFAPIILFSGLSGYLGGLLLWTERYGWAAFQIPAATLVGLGLMILVAAHTHSLTLVAGSVSAGYAVAFVIAWVAVTRRLGHAWLVRQGQGSLREALALPRSIVSPALGQVLGGQALVVVERALALTVGVGAVATLSYARGISAAPVFVAQAIGAGVYPGIVRAASAGDSARVRESFMKALRVNLLVGSAFMFYFAFFGPSIGTALLQRGALSGTSASGVGHALIAFAPATAATGVLVFAVAVLFGIGEFRGILERSLVAVAAYSVLAPLLLLSLRAWGLALAFSLSQVFGAVFVLFLVGRKIELAPQTLARHALLPAALLAAPIGIALGLYRALLEAIGFGIPVELRGIMYAGSSFLLTVVLVIAACLFAPLPESRQLRRFLTTTLHRA